MGRGNLWYLGIAGPVFFVFSVTVLSWIKPGYSQFYNTISELGETGPVAQAASLMFIVTGIMITLFGYGLHYELAGGEKRVWSGFLVMFFSVFDFIGSGVFPVDPGGASVSFVAIIHVYATLIGELAAVAMPIYFIKDTEGALIWETHRKFCSLVFWVSLPLLVFLGYCIQGHSPGDFDTPIGLAQRLLVGLFLVWISVTALRLRELGVNKVDSCY